MKWVNPFALIVGVETEYGVLAVEPHHAQSSTLISADLVNAYAKAWGSPRWDYEGENPFQDMRGGRIDRRKANTNEPSKIAPLTEDGSASASDLKSSLDSSGVMVTALGRVDGPKLPSLSSNALTHRGGRFYVDHGHPEVSSPECVGPLAAVWEDVRNDELISAANDLCGGKYRVFKNSVDQHGNTWGHHENYRIPRQIPWDLLVDSLGSFLASRPLYCGAGRVRSAEAGEVPGFEISQRAAHVKQLEGLYTTHNRPLVNSRDEPHDDACSWRRLHLIVGDPNRCAFSTYLRLSATSLFLWTIWTLWQRGETQRLRQLQFAQPVSALHTICADVTLKEPVQLLSGQWIPPLDLVFAQLDLVQEVWTAYGLASEADALVVEQALADWRQTLLLMQENLFSAADRVEWIAKLVLLERQRQKLPQGWKSPRLQVSDISWADLSSPTSLFSLYQGKIGFKSVPAAATGPSPRAVARARLAQSPFVSQVGWSTAVISSPDTGQRYRFSLGTADDCVDILGEDGSSQNFQTILNALSVQKGIDEGDLDA